MRSCFVLSFGFMTKNRHVYGKPNDHVEYKARKLLKLPYYLNITLSHSLIEFVFNTNLFHFTFGNDNKNGDSFAMLTKYKF